MHAGDVLADVWSKLIVDGHPTVAKFIQPENSELDRNDRSTTELVWQAKHLRRSQYFLQIVKCLDPKCCNKFRSSYLNVM